MRDPGVAAVAPVGYRPVGDIYGAFLGLRKMGEADIGDFPKISTAAIRFHPLFRPWCVPNERSRPMPNKPVVLVNVLKVESKRQEALIALLKQNIDTVVRTLDGWKTSRLIAAADGATVVIYSEWETPAAFEAMRNDARMQACFAKILELANVDSIVGGIVLSESP
ncbi:antibiotic biosynthesis monooxygenase [Pseudolysobacter antarcticus]|uniref:Antibiotic biosynthesis monooxygenase n=2 Tax=Pseudolysobacter antarcticus TaxID=2511995 RepID=A0A411HEZ3_9GAMM|nr:antibiotic biosynthesis monooxygenase [Pseudolysobacter antarcticus]